MVLLENCKIQRSALNAIRALWGKQECIGGLILPEPWCLCHHLLMIIIIVYEEKDNDGKRKVAPGLKESRASTVYMSTIYKKARNLVNHPEGHSFWRFKVISTYDFLTLPRHNESFREIIRERNQQSMLAVIWRMKWLKYTRNVWNATCGVKVCMQYKSVVRGACWFSPSGDYLLHIWVITHGTGCVFSLL